MSTTLRKIGSIICWSLSVFLIFIGVFGFFSGDILAGGGTALMGAALLPRLRKIGEFPLTPWIRCGIVVAGFLLLLIGVPRKSGLPDTQPEAATSTSFIASERKEGSTDDAAQIAQSIAVTAIIDGDTIKVRLTNGTEEKVRIIGLDAPETSPMECFGKESSAKLSLLLAEKNVTLETQLSDDRDSFGRLLRYVSFDGRDIGAEMVREGYAESYRKYPHPRIDAYNVLEIQAKQQRLGLWSICVAGQVLPPSGIVSSVPKSNPTPSSVSSAPVDAAPQEPIEQVQIPTATGGDCVIKGNVNSKGDKIYHLPGCGSYKQTQIKTGRG